MSPINQIPCLEFWNRLQQMFCFSVKSSSVIRPVGGTYGFIARFWLLYVDLVHICMLYDRACRTNDVSLYTHALGLMCPVFFATLEPNYARSMSLYHLNLLNVEATHPGIQTNSEAGALSVRQTRHSFSRSAVDVTLEQTANRGAASRQSGIACFTQNVGARKRWTVISSLRGAVVSMWKSIVM